MLNGVDKKFITGNLTATYSFNKNFDVMLRSGIEITNEERTTKRPYSSANYLQGYYREQYIKNSEYNTDVLFTFKNNYGKIINGSSSEILTNCNLTGDEAEAKIVALFGSIDLFKSCVQDMLDNHTRYFYHTEGGADSCKEINGLAWKNADTYELDFLYEYWTSGIPYTKKVVLQVADSNNTRIAIIEDISTDKSLEQKFAPSEKRLESNSDLNDYKTQGSWWESSTATLNTIANKPVGRVGEAVLQVFRCGNNYKLQVFHNIKYVRMVANLEIAWHLYENLPLINQKNEHSHTVIH